MEAFFQLKCQYERLQNEYESQKERLRDTECKVEAACFETKRIHFEYQKKASQSDKQEKTILSLQATLATKDEEICYKSQTITDLERQLSDTKSRLDEACKLYRAKDTVTQDYLVELQRLEKDNESLKCEIKQREQNEVQLEESLRAMQCSYENLTCQLKMLQDPCNANSAMKYIDQTILGLGTDYFCNRTSEEVANFLKQEISCFQQVFATNQEEGLSKLSQILMAKVLLEKEGCDFQRVFDENEKEINCLRKELEKCTCETGQMIQELQCTVQKLECDLRNREMAYQQLDQAFQAHDSRLNEVEKLLTEERNKYDRLCGDFRNSEVEWKCKIEELTHKLRCTEDDLQTKKYTCQQLEQSIEIAECQAQEIQACNTQERKAREECNRKLMEYQCQYQTKEKQACDLEKCLEQSYEQNHRLNQQIEVYCKLESYIDRVIARFMGTTNHLAAKYGPLSEYCNPCATKCGSDTKNYEEFEQRLDFLCNLARTAPEDKQMVECLRQELLKKDKQMGEMLCNLQKSQAKVCELQTKMQTLEMQFNEACRQLECCGQQLEIEKETNCQWEKSAAQMEFQLKEMAKVKNTCQCLQNELSETEKDLAAERENCCCLKDALFEMQKANRMMQDELKAKDDCLSLVNLQVKRQDCEIKALNDKVRTLQDCNACRRNSTC